MRDRAEMLPVPCLYHLFVKQISSACRRVRVKIFSMLSVKGAYGENEEEGYEKYRLDKALFKSAVTFNVKNMFRRTIDEATLSRSSRLWLIQ